jgi:hypothetical protein
MNTETIVNRRSFVRGAGAAGAGLLVATRTPVASLFGSADAAAASACASLTPAKTIGPYFVEEKLNRSDITTDPATGAVTTGVPLRLAPTLVNEDDGCSPLAGAQVDIWHADPSGKYSDESVEGTSGKKYLRGYRVTGSDGKVAFKTSIQAGTRGAPCTSTCACARSSRRCSSTTCSRTPSASSRRTAHAGRARPATPTTTSTAATAPRCFSRSSRTVTAATPGEERPMTMPTDAPSIISENASNRLCLRPALCTARTASRWGTGRHQATPQAGRRLTRSHRE